MSVPLITGDDFLLPIRERTVYDIEDDQKNATKMKWATAIVTLVAIGALGYFGVHILAGAVSGQLLGGALSGVASGLGSYLLIARTKDWNDGKISDSDKMTLALIGGLGIAGIVLSIPGIAVGASLAGPIIGSGLGFLTAVGAKRAFDPERIEERKRIAERKALRKAAAARRAAAVPGGAPAAVPVPVAAPVVPVAPVVPAAVPAAVPVAAPVVPIVPAAGPVAVAVPMTPPPTPWILRKIFGW